jgi:hypothetical protein
MKLSKCRNCGLPVLELEGQFSKLDSLYLDDNFPRPETSGKWHARCLAESDAALLWYECRLRNFRDVRGYQPLAEYPHWTVVREPRRGDVIAFGRSGELLSLSRGNRKRARKVEEGRIYPKLEDEFHFELDDPDLVRSMQEGLLNVGSYPLPAVLDAMGIRDKVVHPEAIERGVFRFNKRLQAEWGKRFASASAEYGVFVPTELEPHVGEFVR